MGDIVKVISVKLDAMVRISDKCWKATAFDGSEALIPDSQYFGVDYAGGNASDAHWVSNWILSKVDLQYSSKRHKLFDKDSKRFLEEKINHNPEKKDPIEVEADALLTR